MKRFNVLAVLLIVACALVTDAYAGGRGARKVPFEPNVGWVIVNSTGSLRLNATAHLESGAPNEVFDVSVRVRYEDGTIVPHTNIATLWTNNNGKGNVKIDVPLDPPPGSGTVRRIAVRLRRPGPPNILYVAVVWDAPLKGNPHFTE